MLPIPDALLSRKRSGFDRIGQNNAKLGFWLAGWIEFFPYSLGRRDSPLREEPRRKCHSEHRGAH
jgi:hypothetical protein